MPGITPAVQPRVHRNRVGPGRSMSGFTLIELVITLAILVILVTVGIPGFRDTILDNRRATTMNLMVTSLHMARSEAIRRSARVTVCKSADGQSCAASGGWQQGWIVFADADEDARVDAGEDVVHVQGALADGARLTGNALVDEYLSYVPSGRLERVSGAFQAGTLSYCDGRGADSARFLVLNTSGRPRLAGSHPGGGTSCP